MRCSLFLCCIALLLFNLNISGQNPDLIQSEIDSLLTGTVFPDSLYRNHDFESFFLLDAVKQQIDTQNIDYGLLNAATFYAMNEIRSKKRRSELIFDPHLRDAAFLHSIQMVKHNFFAHINRKEQKFKDVGDRYKFFNVQYFQGYGEIITYVFLVDYISKKRFRFIQEDSVKTPYYTNRIGQPTSKLEMHTYESIAKAAVIAWMKSKPHKRIMLGRSFRYAGAGVMVDPGTIGRKNRLPDAKFTANFY